MVGNELTMAIKGGQAGLVKMAYRQVYRDAYESLRANATKKEFRL